MIQPADRKTTPKQTWVGPACFVDEEDQGIAFELTVVQKLNHSSFPRLRRNLIAGALSLVLFGQAKKNNKI